MAGCLPQAFGLIRAWAGRAAARGRDDVGCGWWVSGQGRSSGGVIAAGVV